MHIDRKRFLSLTLSLAAVTGVSAATTTSDASSAMAIAGEPSAADRLAAPSKEGGAPSKEGGAPSKEGGPVGTSELREAKAHVIADVPGDWTITADGDYAMGAPKDNSFHLRIVGIDRGELQESEADGYLSSFIQKHFTNVQVSQKARRIDYNNFRGYEMFGTGNEKDGSPGKFFVLVLHDKKSAKRGVVAVGTGTVSGFEKHNPGIREALRTLRTF